MTPLNAIATKDSLVNIVRKVHCQLYSIRFVSGISSVCGHHPSVGGHLHTIDTNVDIAPELVERLHPTTSVHVIASFAAEFAAE